MSRMFAAIVFLALPLLAVACGGSGAGNGSQSPLGELLSGPPELYSPAVEELPGYFTVDPGLTFAWSAGTFASLGPFTSTTEGDRLAADWGYEHGYQVVFEPDGLLAGVLEGRYYATVAVHQFKTTSGARDAFAHYKSWSDGVEGSKKEKAPDLGDEAGAWSFVQGFVGSSEMELLHHRVLIRRGNILIDVRTRGGQPFMTIDHAAGIAEIIDERATGGRPAELPTPISAPTSPAF